MEKQMENFQYERFLGFQINQIRIQIMILKK